MAGYGAGGVRLQQTSKQGPVESKEKVLTSIETNGHSIESTANRSHFRIEIEIESKPRILYAYMYDSTDVYAFANV